MPDLCRLCANNGFCKYLNQVLELELNLDSFHDENEKLLEVLDPIQINIACGYFRCYGA